LACSAATSASLARAWKRGIGRTRPETVAEECAGMDQQTVTLIAAVVAVIVAVFNLLLNSRFTLDRERR